MWIKQYLILCNRAECANTWVPLVTKSAQIEQTAAKKRPSFDRVLGISQIAEAQAIGGDLDKPEMH